MTIYAVPQSPSEHSFSASYWPGKEEEEVDSKQEKEIIADFNEEDTKLQDDLNDESDDDDDKVSEAKKNDKDHIEIEYKDVKEEEEEEEEDNESENVTTTTTILDRAKMELDIINKLEAQSTQHQRIQNEFCAISVEWRKKWLSFAIGLSSAPPGTIETDYLVDFKFIDKQVILQKPGYLPIKKEMESVVLFIPAIIFRQYAQWYGLRGPEIIRPSNTDIEVHRLRVSCQSQTKLFCVLKSITREGLCKIIVDVFDLPSVHCIRELKLQPSSVDDEEDVKEDFKNVQVSIEDPIPFGPVKYDKLKGGLSGLGNIGNTCYMASALQALVHTQPLIEGFLDRKLSLGKVSLEFAALLDALWRPKQHASLASLKESLATRESRFASFNQQDSQELLAVLLDHVNEEIRKKHFPIMPPKQDANQIESWSHFISRNDSLITNTFGGLLKSSVQCTKCKFSSDTFDPFLFLSLPIPVKSGKKLIIGVFGQGQKNVSLTSPLDTVGDLRLQLDLREHILLLASDEGRFLRLLDDEDEYLADFLSMNNGNDESFMMMRRNKPNVRVYAFDNTTADDFTIVSFSKTSYIFSTEPCLYPLILKKCNSEEQVQEQLQMLFGPGDTISQLKYSEESGIYIVKVNNEHYDDLLKLFCQWIPPLNAISPNNNIGKDVITLQDCLDAFENEEYLDEQVGWKCPKCHKIRPALKSLTIAQCPPKCLMLHLKRFAMSGTTTAKSSWFGMGRKVTTPVSFPTHMDIKGHQYTLYAVIDHYGSLFGGHYTCSSRHPYLSGPLGEDEDVWYRFDDSFVNKINLEEVLSKSASSGYVLFYQIKK